MDFQLASEYEPRGDQAQAIAKLTKSLRAGNRHQTLLGVTGSGKTFTAANVIRNLGKPTLVISHNKTLAAQLYSEFKQFFPNNAVEYFVSYFDYYQPEAYIPRTDTYIEKDSSINQEIERLRLSTTSALLSRKDVIVVSSVSCIYGLGSPEDYRAMLTPLSVGQQISREAFLAKLVDMLYERNDIAFTRGKFRVRGDVIEVCSANEDEIGIRVEFFGDEIDRISLFDPLTGKVDKTVPGLTIFPAKQFVTPHEKLRRAQATIREELDQRIAQFETEGKLLEAQRLKMRTEYDLEMLQEMGFCSGIENYTRHLSGRPPDSTPYTLLDFFPDDFLLVVDESHATIPQIGGMYEGDRSRKSVLVDYGFRLPSAMDNRPLKFPEFMGAPAADHLHQRDARAVRDQQQRRRQQDLRPPPARGRRQHRRGRDDARAAGRDARAPRRAGTYLQPRRANRLRPSRGPNLKIIRQPRDAGRQRRATPAASGNGNGYEDRHASSDIADSFDVFVDGQPLIVEQIIRPTGLLDPANHRQAAQEPDRRHHRGLPPAHRGGRAHPRHHADQAHRRGPDRLPARRGLEGALPAQRHRHHRARGNPARRCGRRSSIFSSASTSCAKDSTCRRCRWCASSTPTRKAICAARPRSSRRRAAPPGTSTATSSCSRTRSRRACESCST